jgi:hypothetical protein
MKLKPFLTPLAIALTIASATIYFQSSSWTILRVRASAKPIVAHTVSLLERTEDEAGARVMSRRIRAVRSDGSEVRVDQSLSADGTAIVDDSREIVFTDRLVVRINPMVNSKSSRRAFPADFENGFWGAKRLPQDRCIKTLGGEDMRDRNGEKLVGEENYKGLRTVRILRHQENTPKIESWYALDYACGLVAEVIEYSHRGADRRLIRGKSIKEMEWIRAGQPEPTLFATPDHFEEVAPSELAGRIAERRTGDRKCVSPDMVQREDARYFAQRP